MGQGQGEVISAAIAQAAENGWWLYIQNCHLGISIMQTLEHHFENLGSDLHKDFRIWLSLVPFKEFPISILQKGVKVNFE